jgi:hypothetical protein
MPHVLFRDPYENCINSVLNGLEDYLDMEWEYMPKDQYLVLCSVYRYLTNLLA